MLIDTWIQIARQQNASDLHVEPGMPLAVRVRGQLRMVGAPIAAATIAQGVRELLSDDDQAVFRERHSLDFSRTIGGLRCRVHVLRSARGVGLAVRLLTAFQASLRKLNLHPDLAKLVQHRHGLILISGPTGSGKSSTLAALIQEINTTESRHIVTVESPIEYALVSQKSLIRQREVGRDTPSFEQALVDAMRQNPDVLMVGEMRDPETMRLVLNAAETGHLVLATVHSSTVGEALARLVSAFAPDIQNGMAAQLADALVAVVGQRLVARGPGDRLVPELEILLANTAARATIRQGQFSKIQSVLESGGLDGCWTLSRYRDWLGRRTDFYVATDNETEPAADLPPPPARDRPPMPARAANAPVPRGDAGVLVLDDEDDPLAIIRALEGRGRS